MDVHLVIKLKSSYDVWEKVFINHADVRSKYVMKVNHYLLRQMIKRHLILFLTFIWKEWEK